MVSFTTDNGGNENNCLGGTAATCWAPALYSGRNSQLISSMINWAIGDPRPKEGVVINAEDIWAGTAGRVIESNGRSVYNEEDVQGLLLPKMFEIGSLSPDSLQVLFRC